MKKMSYLTTNNDVLLYFDQSLKANNLNPNLKYLFLFLLSNYKNYSDVFLNQKEKINFPSFKAKKLINHYCKKNLPYEYFFKKCFFLDKTFYVKKNVFIPRPETEELVNITKEILNYYPFFKIYPLIDLCSGTGVIGISLSSFFKKIFFVEKSLKARTCLKKNIKLLLNHQVKILKNAFSLKEKIVFLVSNPPYLKKNEIICNFSKNQEKDAFFYKNYENEFIIDFLNYIKEKKLLSKKYFLIFEINFYNLDFFLKKLAKIFTNFYLVKDLQNKIRFLIITSIKLETIILKKFNFLIT